MSPRSRPTTCPASSDVPNSSLLRGCDGPVAISQFEVLVRVVNIDHKREVRMCLSDFRPTLPHFCIELAGRKSFASELISN